MIEPCGEGFRLCYGGLTIPFHIESGARKRLSITVFPELRLRVLAPADATTAAVLERVDRRAKWIARQWRFFQEAAPPTPPRLYISGETHWYLGRQYRLKVRDYEENEKVERVKLSGRFFWIYTRNRDDTARTQKLLNGWHEVHAQKIFAARLEKCVIDTRALTLGALPPLVVRRHVQTLGELHRKWKNPAESRTGENTFGLR